MRASAKILLWIIFIIILFLQESCINTGPKECEDPPEICIVKNGYYRYDSTKKFGVAVNNFFISPQWDSFKTQDGTIYVDVFGEIYVLSSKTHILIQFQVNIEEGTFEYIVMTLNGIEQSYIIYQSLLEEMFNT